MERVRVFESREHFLRFVTNLWNVTVQYKDGKVPTWAFSGRYGTKFKFPKNIDFIPQSFKYLDEPLYLSGYRAYITSIDNTRREFWILLSKPVIKWIAPFGSKESKLYRRKGDLVAALENLRKRKGSLQIKVFSTKAFEIQFSRCTHLQFREVSVPPYFYNSRMSIDEVKTTLEKLMILTEEELLDQKKIIECFGIENYTQTQEDIASLKRVMKKEKKVDIKQTVNKVIKVIENDRIQVSEKSKELINDTIYMIAKWSVKFTLKEESN